MALLSPKTLKVHPNPFHALDHKGRPACAVRLDPDESGGDRRYIGAVRKSVLVTGKKYDDRNDPQSGPDGEYDVGFEFDLAAVDIPDTHYHRARLRDGELIPADESTAVRGGVIKDPKDFKAAKDVLEAERARATEHLKKEHDAELADVCVATPPAEPETKASVPPPKAPRPAAPKELAPKSDG